MAAGSRERVLIVGCGGIGGVLGARLSAAGADPFIATTNEAVRRALTERGPRVDGVPGPRVPETRVLGSAKDAPAPFDVVLVAVQPTEVEAVCRDLEGRLSESGRVVCLPNGLCEDRIAALLGPERVVGAVVAWGARMPSPGEYLQTSSGGFSVGWLRPGDTRDLTPVTRLLESVGPVTLTDNLRGARFAKLAINCAVSTLGTIGGTKLGELLVRADARRLALDILAEAVQVARAEGTRLEPVISMDLDWFGRHGQTGPLHAAARHAMLLAIGARYRNLRSSMLAAIERGRTPAVDFLNGEVTSRGARLGVPTPVNEAARRVVWEIARSERAPGPAALARVSELAESIEGRG
jgi:2-dehydropantoate 2-reductase